MDFELAYLPTQGCCTKGGSMRAWIGVLYEGMQGDQSKGSEALPRASLCTLEEAHCLQAGHNCVVLVHGAPTIDSSPHQRMGRPRLSSSLCKSMWNQLQGREQSTGEREAALCAMDAGNQVGADVRREAGSQGAVWRHGEAHSGGVLLETTRLGDSVTVHQVGCWLLEVGNWVTR